MKERTKHFRSDEVKAILDGRKTQFLEAIKIPEGGRIKPATHYDTPCDSHNGGVAICFDQSGLADWGTLACPYGQVGDRLRIKDSRITLEITEIEVQDLNCWVWVVTFKKLV